ncbi:ABC transporter ATP-binding protein [Craterilacuibacter sp. RT1T]|uniref:energy-coupling factor ABC transporter ATP-binding protein n=1 Tax=Craterilacuibacter sp. RT1T TaxID=2942211 RepID=UPI0020BEF2A8|nr:ABC transporter ATP-binding protein [Craterilacuibacter sp. RT1T]MCL6263189.1 energy-coupling factor ABC transporter ATP-binding protein [Craterilacuibacter sp. RT1T]
MSHHLLIARDLAFAYPDQRPALDGVSFALHHGEAVAIVGANGAGKSTLLMLLTGCLSASRGEVLLGHIRLDKRSLAAFRRSIGFVFQNPDDQLFMPTVFDDVAFGPLNLGVAPADVPEVVSQALAAVGAEALAARAPWQLSGGQKRAVAIAGVLAMQPDILLMDEPSDALDPASRRRLISLLQGFEHSKLIATHDLDLVLDVCTRVIVLGEGRILADAHPLEVFADDALLARASLERPLSMQTRGSAPARPAAANRAGAENG